MYIGFGSMVFDGKKTARLIVTRTSCCFRVAVAAAELYDRGARVRLSRSGRRASSWRRRRAPACACSCRRARRAAPLIWLGRVGEPSIAPSVPALDHSTRACPRSLHPHTLQLRVRSQTPAGRVQPHNPLTPVTGPCALRISRQSRGWRWQYDVPANVFHFDGRISHSWLMPQMAAVVHHGGAGTVGMALSRCPRLHDFSPCI